MNKKYPVKIFLTLLTTKFIVIKNKRTKLNVKLICVSILIKGKRILGPLKKKIAMLTMVFFFLKLVVVHLIFFVQYLPLIYIKYNYKRIITKFMNSKLETKLK